MDIVERCFNYLSNGGLFNPELADHNAVRSLVIDCRDEIERLREALRSIANDSTDLLSLQAGGYRNIARDALMEKE